MSARALKGIIALTVSAALVAGCASGPRKPSPRALKQIDRALANAPGKAQPSTIVKTELLLNRMAREDGLIDAYRYFAAPGAKVHSDDGVNEIGTVLSKFKNPAEPSQFETKSVFMSCDGSVAVSQGRGRDPDGKVGNYVFVWERQPGIRADGDEETGYRYVYITAAPDDPQPPKKPVVTPGPGDIVVEAIDSVRADIASCGPKEDIFLEALAEPASGIQIGRDQSRDRTLQWNWADFPDNRRRVTVSLWRKGTRETVLSLDLPSAP